MKVACVFEHTLPLMLVNSTLLVWRWCRYCYFHSTSSPGSLVGIVVCRTLNSNENISNVSNVIRRYRHTHDDSMSVCLVIKAENTG
jgi:hypothetical protein